MLLWTVLPLLSATATDIACAPRSPVDQQGGVQDHVGTTQGLHLMQFHTQTKLGTQGGSKIGSGGVDVTLEVQTGVGDYAQTETAVAVAFKVDGTWTRKKILCEKSSLGQLVKKNFVLDSWPTQLRISAEGTDAFAYERIVLMTGDAIVTPLTVKMGSLNYSKTSIHWVDGNEWAPDNNTYNVSGLPGVKVSREANCTTKHDERAWFPGYETSPAGTRCVFGLDSRDEGWHCVYTDGKYGTFGWCYTSADRSSWGSCSENCPLFGPFKKLEKQIKTMHSHLTGKYEEEMKAIKKAAAGRTATAAPIPSPSGAPAPPPAGNATKNSTAGGKADGKDKAGKAAGTKNSTAGGKADGKDKAGKAAGDKSINLAIKLLTPKWS